MSLVLYHYVHCPFCVRVRLALGYLNLSYESRVLAYDDEKTPVELIGKKMLPILKQDQQVMNESLDIIAALDVKHQLGTNELKNDPHFPQFEKLLSEIGGPVHSLAMPYWIWTPEFNESSRDYFQQKKEEKRGPFQVLYKRRNEFVQELKPILKKVAADLQPFYRSKNLGIYDVMLAAHLWGLYVVPEFQFSPELHEYLQKVKELCSFEYHQDFWS